MDVSGKAIVAYNKLLTEKYNAMPSVEKECVGTKEASRGQGEGRMMPRPSQSPMTKQQSSRGEAEKWGEGTTGDKSMASVDALIVEFEHGFESIAAAAGNLVNQSRTMMRHSTYVSDSFSLIGARQSRVRSADESDVSGLNGLNDDNMSGLPFGSVTSQSMTSESAADVSAILERYSDRLVTMVSEKMMATQSKTS